MELRKILNIVAFIIIVFSIIPFVPANYWWIRGFDFPHLQLTIITLSLLLIYLIKVNLSEHFSYIVAIALFVCLAFQFSKIYPYTFLSKYEVLNSEKKSGVSSIAIYTANVYQNNKNYTDLFASIKKRNPDVLLLTETNQRWRTALSRKFNSSYPFRTEAPFENTYGMMLFSKYKLVESKVNFLVEDTIPSIHSKLILPSRDTIQLFAIHPAPPVPIHNPSSIDRDAELMKIAKLSKISKFPVIVMGDFNDVAWSETTELFQEFSGLLDMRKGRGLFNTYNANNILLRWPLDHVFMSSEFRVVTVDKGEKIGSDHFPFFTKLSYEPSRSKVQNLEPPTQDETDRALDQIKNEEEQEN